MAILNAAYETLSDPKLRRQHDLWIENQERAESHQKKYEEENFSTSSSAGNAAEARFTVTRKAEAPSHAVRNFIFACIAIIAIWQIFPDQPPSASKGPKPYLAEPPKPEEQLVTSTLPLASVYVRPTTAPNGKPWPLSAGYIKGYQRLNSKGLSSVTVDNSKNDSDVFVKLVHITGENSYPVRHFYIPAFRKFTVKSVTPGTYDIRYRDLNSGNLSRSESFSLEEIETYQGVQYGDITMTLYKVANGNMQTYGLSELEF